MSNETEEPKGYAVVDRRRVRAEEPPPRPREVFVVPSGKANEVFDGEIDIRTGRRRARVEDQAPEAAYKPTWLDVPKVPPEGMFDFERSIARPDEVEMRTERTEAPEQSEPPKLNRAQRRAQEKIAKQEAKRFAKKMVNLKPEEIEGDESPLDPVSFLQVASEHLNTAVSAIQRELERIPESARLSMDEMAHAIQVAFMLGYLDAYGPASEEGRLRILSAAQSFKSKFKFKHQDGEIVKPKAEPLIQPAGPLIIPG